MTPGQLAREREKDKLILRRLERDVRAAYKVLDEVAHYVPARVGKFAIEEHVVPAKTKMCVVGPRIAINQGVPVGDITFSKPRKVHTLIETDGGMWMSTDPRELWQAQAFLKQAGGRVLLAGLGLGVTANLASVRPRISEVTTVEISPEVCQLIRDGGHLHGDVTVVQADIFDFLRDCGRGQFDCIFLDTWASTGEFCWADVVVPMRRAAGKIASWRRIFAWQEEDMWGQVVRSMAGAAILDHPTEYRTHLPYAAFWMANPDLRPKLEGDQTQQLMTAQALMFDPEYQRRAQGYLTLVGSPMWEEMYGEHWDKADEASKRCHVEEGA